MTPSRPGRGDVWLTNFDPTRGHEQAGTRPAVVVSVDLFNYGPAGLIVVLPVTSTDRRVPLHVRVEPPEGGLREVSYVKCEDVRSIAVERLVTRWGALSLPKLIEIEDRLRVLLGL